MTSLQPESGASPMRILMVSERFAPDLGGVAVSTTRIAEALVGIGVDVEVMAWSRRLPAGQMETTGRDDPRRPTVHRLGRFGSWDATLQHTMIALEWLHGQDPFHAAWGHYLVPAGFAAVLFAESVGIASTVSARGNDVDRLAFPPGDFARLQWTLQRASVLTAVSRELAGKVEVLLGEDQPVHVLPNSVDGEVFVAAQEDGVRERLGVRPDELVLGFCGELREKKGMSFLLTAFREIRQRREACLLVIGEVRPREQSKLTEFAVESPDAAERILVTEHLETPAEVASCLNACDIVLQPSLWDGMPNSVLEAMACGRVVLASDAGGMPEVIDHDATGFLVPRVQLGALGVAIEEVVELSDARRTEIGAAAAEHVRKHFNAEVEAVALAEIVALLQAD